MLPEWNLALISPKPIFFSAQESIWNYQILLMKVIIKTEKGYNNKKSNTVNRWYETLFSV